jgi:versiconal hemiacetal acetate esterase
VPVTCHPDIVPKEFRDMYKAYEENAEYSANTTSAMMAFIGKTSKLLTQMALRLIDI